MRVAASHESCHPALARVWQVVMKAAIVSGDLHFSPQAGSGIFSTEAGSCLCRATRLVNERSCRLRHLPVQVKFVARDRANECEHVFFAIALCMLNLFDASPLDETRCKPGDGRMLLQNRKFALKAGPSIHVEPTFTGPGSFA